ncbi:plastocyanin/azurin family copper-binding protein [Hydrogenophaga sp.]|uniref:cupredoxin domain-containing protein n=1 Tax=Hydrogenophaga sp. TaxID=1904254 RepID=UPI003564C77B
MKKWTLSILLAALATVAAPAWAHGDAGHVPKPSAIKMEQKPWGIAGQPKARLRTIAVRMSDDMRFTPDKIDVKQGETIRFVLTNAGQVMHEYVLGTQPVLEEHAALMKRFPNMEHDEPYMAHVAPGQKGEIVWTFNRAGDFDFACLLPGHYEAGMAGKIKVVGLAN